MPTLYDPIQLGGLTLPNRFAMAPLTRNRSPGAVPGPYGLAYYTQRASAGLIVTEGTAIAQQGQGHVDIPGLYGADQIAGWRKITDAVHDAGGRIFTQIWHVGRVSHSSLQPGGGAPVAPSAIQAKTKTFILKPDGTREFMPTSEPRALDRAELAGIVADYARAAKAAVADAGFDGIEVHGANGYLIDQFLRSGTNRRTDDYGGSIENRARLLFEVVDAVVAAIGGSKTAIRISPVTPSNDASDPDPQPLFEHVVRGLAARGLAYIHVIEGATGGLRDFQQGETPFDWVALKAPYRDAGGTGVWMVNNGYDRALAEDAVASGRADMVAFGRLYIANPDLVHRFETNAPLNEPRRPTFYGGGAEGYIDYSTADISTVAA